MVVSGLFAGVLRFAQDGADHLLGDGGEGVAEAGHGGGRGLRGSRDEHRRRQQDGHRHEQLELCSRHAESTTTLCNIW